MARLMTFASVLAAALLTIGCSRPLTHADAGTSGAGGARIMTGGAGATASGAAGASGGATGAGGGATGVGGGGASPATDGGSDQSSCVAVCGQVTGVVADPPGSCTFPLLCARPLGFTGLIVFVDGQTVPQDSIEGWMYTDSSSSAVRPTGHFCAAVMTTNAAVDVDYLCEVAAP